MAGGLVGLLLLFLLDFRAGGLVGLLLLFLVDFWAGGLVGHHTWDDQVGMPDTVGHQLVTSKGTWKTFCQLEKVSKFFKSIEEKT